MPVIRHAFIYNRADKMRSILITGGYENQGIRPETENPMHIQINSRVFEDTVFIEVNDDGRLTLTLNVPLTSDFIQIEEEFYLKDEEEYVDWVTGLVLPSGYFAIGVFKGRRSTIPLRIFLVGKGLSLELLDEAAVYRAIAAHEAKLKNESSGFRR
ncbi:hypothetical protein [Rhizobium sp. Rhizsp42]|uniref:hypothetical protein n=1 Tax=Rhizobium sp. Rhizsp42 TaxID=3243034 RepID=UPI0039AFFADD